MSIDNLFNLIDIVWFIIIPIAFFFVMTIAYTAIEEYRDWKEAITRDGDIRDEDIRVCGECGSEFVGRGYPILDISDPNCIVGISDPNCGQCYGHVNGVYKESSHKMDAIERTFHK